MYNSTEDENFNLTVFRIIDHHLVCYCLVSIIVCSFFKNSLGTPLTYLDMPT